MILHSAFFIGFLLGGARRYSVGFGVSRQNGVGFGVGFGAGFLALLAVVIKVVTTSQSVALHGYRRAIPCPFASLAKSVLVHQICQG